MFLNLLNKQHSNIQFTAKKSTPTRPLLDVDVQIRGNKLDSSVSQKTPNDGRLLNVNAICPNAWKSSLVLCLNRVKSIGSSQHLFEVEIGKLKHVFYF